jgi:hypothetical protein
MPRRGSLPWLLLAAVLSTLFAIWIEASFIHPVEQAITGTTLWQTNQLDYAYQGRVMVANFVRFLLVVWVLGIWAGVLIDARRSV